MGMKRLWMRLSGGLLAASMVLSSSAFSVTANAADTSSITSDISFAEAASIISDATLESGSLEPEVIDIPVEAGQKLNEIASLEETYVGALDGEFSSHDWSAYVSPTLPSRLSSKEKQLYDKYDEVLSTFLNNSNVDAELYKTSSYSYYITPSVHYSTYGLSKDKAFAVAQMFLYNNPQYYFATSVFLTTSNDIWFTVYDDFADGDKRAKTTTALFTELDKWIVACSDYEATTYMKERSSHNKIRDMVSYVSGKFDQSIYSAIIEKKTVCAGYAKVLTMMLNAMGIDTMTVLSDCHAWNVVQLDDKKWYAVDCTWNDSLGDYYFFNVSNANLKRFDTSLKEHNVHKDWSSSWVPAVSASDYVPTYYDTTGMEGDGAIALSSPDDLYGQYDASDDSVRITWSEVPGAAKYEAVVCDYNTNEEIGHLIMAMDHVRITNLQGRNLLVKVRAIGVSDGVEYYSGWSQISYVNGKFSAYKGGGDTTLEAPKNFHMESNSDTLFSLSWDTVSGASGYSIYLYADPDRENLLGSFTSKGTMITVTGISRDRTLYAFIRAFKSVSGNTTYSLWTLLTIDRSKGSVTPGIDESFGRPINIKYTQTGDNSVRVTWTPGEGSVSTNVVVRIGSSTGVQAATLTTGGAAFTLTGMNKDRVYCICLQAVKEDGRVSDWAYIIVRLNTTSGGTTGGATGDTGSSEDQNQAVSLKAPTNLTYTPISASSGRVTWTAASGAVKYDVEIAKSTAFSLLAAKMDLTGTALRVDGTAAGNTYYVRVRSVGNDGSVSSWVSFSFKPQKSSSGSDSGNTDNTSGSKLGTPSNIQMGETDGKYRLTWNPVSGAIGYRVEIYKDKDLTVQAAAIDLTGTSVIVNGMASGHTYYIRVHATGDNGAVSNWIKVAYTKK